VGQQIAFPFEKPFMFSNENIDGMKTIQEWAIKETIGHAERTTLLPRLWLSKAFLHIQQKLRYFDNCVFVIFPCAKYYASLRGNMKYLAT
jgi:hypothetical protein